MSAHVDPRVDDYVRALPRWQMDLCHRLREVIHDADPAVQETVKRKGQPYFVLEGNVCAILAASDHVNLFTYGGAIVADPDRIITGGHGNSTARTIAFYEGDPIPVESLTAMLRQIIANNRAGGWRAVKAATPARRNSEG
jgi:hypothetical protein